MVMNYEGNYYKSHLFGDTKKLNQFNIYIFEMINYLEIDC